MLLTLHIAASAVTVLILVATAAFLYGKHLEEHKRSNMHYGSPDPFDYGGRAFVGGAIILTVVNFLVIAFYNHPIRTSVIVGGIILSVALILLVTKVGNSLGKRSVVKKETLREEVARLKKIIAEELDPIDHSVASMEIAAVTQEALKKAKIERAKGYVEGQF